MRRRPPQRPLEFYKMSGSGNDFIVIDNRDGRVRRRAEFARRHCPRGSAVGADGVLLLESSRRESLRLRIINADGSEAEMCGNGARCMVRYAVEQHGFPSELTMETPAGVIGGRLRRGRVRVDLTAPHGLTPDIELDDVPGYPRGVTLHYVDTGVPHVVTFVDDLEAAPVAVAGRALRHHRRFQPAGANADFVRVEANGRLRVRTYERGVEAETLACGTGVVAAAIVAAQVRGWSAPVRVETRGGDLLTVRFVHDGDRFAAVTLEGSAEYVYRGELT